MRAVELASGAVHVHTDNAAVVASFADPADATVPSKLLAGIYTRIAKFIRAGTASAAKVAGHQDPSAHRAGSDAWRAAVGNDHADCWAKRGVDLRMVCARSRQIMLWCALISRAAARIGHQA